MKPITRDFCFLSTQNISIERMTGVYIIGVNVSKVITVVTVESSTTCV